MHHDDNGDDDDSHDSDNDDDEIDQAAVTVCTDKFEDHTFQHSCGLTFTGLKMMVDKDAERENDGETMMSHWRINMIDFHNNNHNKYLILGHRLLSAIHGWLPRRLSEELIWNSTVNLTGTQGGNLAQDLVNEFQNNDFKNNLKNSHGQYSDNQISRCSKVTGSLGKSIEEVFGKTIIEKYVSNSKATKYSLQSNVSKFVKCYIKENLFHHIRGRRFKGFESYMNTISVKKPNDLQMRLTKYSIKLDKERYVCGQ